MKLRPKKLLFWALAALVPAAGAVLAVRNPSNLAQTRPDHPDPDLRTRLYPRQGDSDALRRTLEAVIPQLTTYGRPWRLVGITNVPDSGGFAVRAEVPVLLYTDDLEVRVQPVENGKHWRVDVRSQSRVGKSDLGENRRHIRQLLGALNGQAGR